MAGLTSLLRACNTPIIPGLAGKCYLGLFPEIDVWPRTLAEIAVGTPGPGETKRYGEAIDYLTGGFHREIDILVDTGTLTETLEGEIGGQMNRAVPSFFIPGYSDLVREFVDCLRTNSGCLNIVITSKSGETLSIGTPEYPCWVQTYEGGPGGDRVGYMVEFYSAHPDTVRSMDLTAFPLGLTPAL